MSAGAAATAITRPAPTLGRRAAARLLDAVGVGAVAAAAGAPSGYGIPWFVATLTGVTAYFVVSDAVAGATPAKRALGLSVVDEHGATPSWGAALRREAVVAVGAIPFAGPILALGAWIGIAVTARSDPAGRGWHDRWSGTRVTVRP